jgi:SAM-dependent methyltransferase
MNAEQYYGRNVLLHGQDAVEAVRWDFTHLPAAPSEMDYALHWLAAENIRGALLDVGCAGLKLLASAEGRFDVRCGVDIASFPAWAAHPQIDARVHNLDGGPLPFADDSFDAVACLMVVEHVFDPYHAVRELRRVCKSTGRVIIGVPNLAGIKRRLELLRGKLPVTSAQHSFSENAWDGYHLHNFTKSSLDWLLRKEGLLPIRWSAQGQFPWIKQRWPALFGNDLIMLAQKVDPRPELPLRL